MIDRGFEMAERILDHSKLSQKIEALKAEGKKVVLAEGCFDLLHVGHVRYLRAAKALGDMLVLALRSDDSVQKTKGFGRPLLPLEDRLGVLEAFEMVDYMTTFDGETVVTLLGLIKPDVFAQRTGASEVKGDAFGGRTIVVQEGLGHTSEGLIREILRKYSPLSKP